MRFLLNITLVPLAFDFDSPEDFVLFIFYILIGTSMVLVAGSVTCGIISTRSLIRQNRFIFMLNTSICDTLTGCGVYYQCLFDVRATFPPKNGTYYVLPSLLGVNLMTFIFAQFDRYVAVCHPFFYGRFISTKLIVCLNVYSWLHVYGQLGVMHLLPLALAWEIAVYSRITLQVIIVIKIIMTVKLLLVARFQLHREPPSAERDSKKESLLIIIVVVSFFLLLWFPAIIHTIVSQLTGKQLTIHNEATNPLSFLSRSNALCTPSIYLWASPSLRAAVWRSVWSKTCCCCKRSKRLVDLMCKCALLRLTQVRQKTELLSMKENN